ncbi:hypothetical protein BDQ94DRAFT_3171 [Aspergillus welwitschiae]|uniref:Uncharacterized protein n=1 Tax=Aspergillus welwitschiae TaxID=1341132 RepID=A0A3F3QJR5_9EURO|nr:hypothetical protein BDQ94DRAFT_3171 [Aspergillus welwitschiae]RDH39209.1 hypothetical protein BDQ94DRAFT_3171 [Aspergillus welwitschiae]
MLFNALIGRITLGDLSDYTSSIHSPQTEHGGRPVQQNHSSLPHSFYPPPPTVHLVQATDRLAQRENVCVVVSVCE